MTLNDGPPVRLSEEGSGATSIELVERDYQIVALTVDARVAMAPTHARVLRVQGGKLEVGKDAVIFVGGPAERHTTGTLAFDKEGVMFALVAVANAYNAFGMAAVQLPLPPTEDLPVAWSLYPDGLDPAPLAASRGVSPIRVARVRPSSLGSTPPVCSRSAIWTSTGEFAPRCILSEAAYIKDVKLEIDRQGAMWIFGATRVAATSNEGHCLDRWMRRRSRVQSAVPGTNRRGPFMNRIGLVACLALIPADRLLERRQERAPPAGVRKMQPPKRRPSRHAPYSGRLGVRRSRRLHERRGSGPRAAPDSRCTKMPGRHQLPVAMQGAPREALRSCFR